MLRGDGLGHPSFDQSVLNHKSRPERPDSKDIRPHHVIVQLEHFVEGLSAELLGSMRTPTTQVQ